MTAYVLVWSGGAGDSSETVDGLPAALERVREVFEAQPYAEVRIVREDAL